MSRWVIAVLVCLLSAAYGCEQKKETATGGGKAGVEDVKEGAAEKTPEKAPEKTPDQPAAKGDPSARAEQLLNDITRQLAAVTSKETAEKTRATLTPLATRLDEAMAEVKKLAAASGGSSLAGMGKSLTENVQGAFGAGLKGAIDKTLAEIRRVRRNEDLIAPIKPLIDKIQAAVNI